MAKTGFKSVEEYLAAQPPGPRAILEMVRKAIRKALPRAEEGISYRIPVYKSAGVAVIYFAGWKDHFSLYPATRRLVRTLGEALAPYKVSHKGTIRFPLVKRVPSALIGRIAKLRAQEAAAKAEAASPERGRAKPGPNQAGNARRAGASRRVS
jgi:uncharacterized protein YdhG (YjbR/CyaY superfamily)